MHTALNAWADKLQHLSLPALPHTVEHLLRLCADSNAQPRQMAAIIEQDPGFSVSLLRRISSQGSKRLRAEITTVEHAAMMLGVERLCQLPASIPLIDSTGNPQHREQALATIGRSLHAAWQARQLARLRRDIEPDEIYLPALLHHLAEILLWLYAPAKMAQIRELTSREEMESEEAQYVVLGFGLDHLTLELARRWNLPPLLQDSLKAESASQSRVYGIMLAVRLARAAEHDWYRPEVTTVLEQVAEYLRLDFGETAAWIHRTAAEAAREHMAPWPLPFGARLLYPSRPEAAPGWIAPTAATVAGAPPPPEQRAERGEAEAAETVLCISPQPRILQQSLAALQSTPPSLQKVLSLTMDGMHDGIGLNRVVFALLTQERHQLRARAIAGADNDPLFSRFSIELNGNHLFTRLMEKPQAIWINDTNRTTFWPLVPQSFYQIIRCNSFFAMSVFVKGRPVGLLYADRHSDTCVLDSRAYHRFKQLALAAAAAMESLSAG